MVVNTVHSPVLANPQYEDPSLSYRVSHLASFSATAAQRNFAVLSKTGQPPDLRQTLRAIAHVAPIDFATSRLTNSRPLLPVAQPIPHPLTAGDWFEMAECFIGRRAEFKEYFAEMQGARVYIQVREHSAWVLLLFTATICGRIFGSCHLWQRDRSLCSTVQC